jgi:hypothetical protein
MAPPAPLAFDYLPRGLTMQRNFRLDVRRSNAPAGGMRKAGKQRAASGQESTLSVD